MGWLRDYMQAAQPPISSFGRLAAACLEHPQWPEECRPKPRSLSTLFSKLDRNQDLDWLRDRLEVQQALSRILGRPLADLRIVLGEPADAKDSAQLRLEDVRYARSMDLVREELPPGFPRPLTTPPAWGPTWWLAPPGSGKGIAARWLQHHGISHTAVIRELSELDRLPPRGPLFLELAPPHGADAIKHGVASIPQLTPEHLQRLRATERPLLIAAPSQPPLELRVERVESPPLGDVLPELVDWVAARLDGTGHFQADRAERWMRQVALPQGAARTWGDALGLLGLLDEVSPRDLQDRSLRELGEFFVRSRVQERVEGATPAIASRCFETLVDAAARSLVAAGRPLEAPHPLEEWIELLSDPAAAEAPDPEWVSRALLGALGHQVSKREVERAAKRLQPTAFMVVRALEQAQLLSHFAPAPEKAGGALRRLRPRWLVTLLRGQAERRILDHASAEWGEFLLHHEEPETVILSLVSRIAADDFSWAYRLLDEFSPRLALAAALEAAVIAIGVSSWCEADLPEELLADLQALLADRAMLLGGSLAAVTCPSDPLTLYSEQWYRVGWLGITRHVPFPLRHLDPYRSDDPQPQQRAALCLLEALPTARGLQSRHPLLRKLGLRLLEALDEVCLDARPACLVLVDSWDRAEQQLLRESQKQCPLQLLFDLHAVRGGRESVPATALWRLLEAEPDLAAWIDDDDLLARLWQQLPPQSLERRVRAGQFIPWSQIPPHVFEGWLSSTQLTELPERAAGAAPLEALIESVKEVGPRGLSSSALSVLLERGAARVFRHLPEWLMDSSQLTHLLEACPAPAASQLVRALPPADTLLKHDPSAVDAIRRFLQRGIQSRAPEAALLYECLERIETAIRPLRKLP